MINAFKNYKSLPKDVFWIFVAIIINRMGNFVIPFLSIILTDRMHLAVDKAGFFVTLSSISGALGLIVGGYLLDKFNRKLIIVSFQFISAILIFSSAFLHSYILLSILLITSVFFSEGSQSGYTAMVTDITNQSNRKEGLTLIYLGINVGTSIGSLLVGFLYTHFIKILFIGDSVSTIISLIFILLFTKTVYSSKEINITKKSNPNTDNNFIRDFIKIPSILLFFLIYIIYSFVYIQLSFSEPIFVNSVFDKNGPIIYGTLMNINAIIVVIFSTFVSNITNKFEPTQNVAFAGLLYAIGFGMLFYANNYYTFVVSTVLWTLGEILASVNSNLYIMNQAPKQCRGRFTTIQPLARRIGYALGPILMGIYIKRYNIRTVWLFIFTLAIMASAFMCLLYKCAKKRALKK